MTREQDDVVEFLYRAITAVRYDPVARVWFADIVEQMLNHELDQIVAEYGATEQDCACVIHTGPCWLHYQRTLVRFNTNLIRRGGQLAWTAYAQAEAARYSELGSELERLERKRTNAH